MKTELTTCIRDLVWISARQYFRKEISAAGEVQRYMKLLELNSTKKAQEFTNRMLIEMYSEKKPINAYYIITEIKKELNL